MERHMAFRIKIQNSRGDWYQLFPDNEAPKSFLQVMKVQKATFYEDGSFVTEPINDIRTYATNTPCEHPARYLEARGKKTDFQTVGTAGICYKERLIISNKCKKCNRIGIKTYSPWSYCSKHSYPALKKTCKICGYTKK